MAEYNRRPLSTSELQDANNTRLGGEGIEELAPLTPVKPQSPVKYGGLAGDIIRNAAAPSLPQSEVYTEEAARAGWGKSRYDTVNPYLPGQDVEEARALEQSSFAKIGSGLMKGGVTAVTTGVNTVAGTVFGVGSSLFELGLKAIGQGNERPGVAGIVDAGVNNWLSQRMINLQKLSEDWFPNYRTEEERTEKYQREWWKHMGTANFIGDSFLKNFGFTVGAMAGGLAWSKVLQRGLYNKLSGDILKASVASAEGNQAAYMEMKSIADAIRAGNMQAIDPTKLAVSIERAAQQINKADSMLQLFGSAISAMGEGTSEGLMAKQEFLDERLGSLNMSREREVEAARRTILESADPRLVAYEASYDEYGRQVSTPVLTEEGERRLKSTVSEIDMKYARMRDLAEEEGDKLATTTFLLNLPILTSSNLVQFGRMFSGGWTTAKKTAASVTGGLSRTAPEAGARGTAKAIGKITADFGGKGNKWTKAVLNSFKVAGSEAFEEMAQGTVSSGAKQVANARMMASYNNDGYDPDAVDSVREWFAEMMQGGTDYLGDIQNWQEGAIGALTGLLGLPGKVWQKGNRWNGGLYQAVKDASKEVSDSRKAAETLNKRVNAPDFQERWHSYIRHLKYDNKMQDAVVANDQYAWQNNNDKQLINDVMAFAAAGRLNDLLQVVDAYGQLSEEDADSIKSLLTQDVNFVPAVGNDIRNMSSKDIVDNVKKRAKDIKDTINQYKRISDALSARLPQGTPDSVINELVFTASQIENFEKRFLTMLDETMTAVGSKIDMASLTTETGENITTEEGQKLRLQELTSTLKAAFSAIDLPSALPGKTARFVENQLDMLEKLVEKNGDKALQTKVADMRKLAKDRRLYYNKFQTLQTAKGIKEHAKQSITPEKVEEQSAKQFAETVAQEIKSVDDVKSQYNSKTEADKLDYLETLKEASKTNKSAKDAYDLINRYREFNSYADSRGYGVGANAVFPEEKRLGGMTTSMMASLIEKLLDNATSEQELMSLPDSIFPTFTDWQNLDAIKRAWVLPRTAETYNLMKRAIRQMMADYLRANNVTSTRTMSPDPVVPTVENETTPSGTEPPQPASVNEPPYPPSTPKPQAPAPVTSPEAPSQEPQPEAETTMAPPPSSDDLVADANAAATRTYDSAQDADIVNETKNETRGQETKPKFVFYRLGMTETSIDGLIKARERGGINRKYADLSDLASRDDPSKNPNFRDTWIRIDDLGGFTTAAVDASVGDEVELVRYQKEDGEFGFPRFDGKEQIVLRLKKNGKVLNTLVRNTSQYYGLESLIDAFEAEYAEWLKTNPAATDVFVFSKTTKIWLKQPGQIDYNYSTVSDHTDFSNEDSIVNVDGYDADAPIVLINKNATPIVIRGDRKAASNFKVADLSQRKGALYYMSKDGNDGYIPIRIFVEHVTPDSLEKDLPIMNEIRGIIADIVYLTKKFDPFDTTLYHTNNNLQSKLRELLSRLDLHNVALEIANVDGVGQALKIWDKTTSDPPVIMSAREISYEGLSRQLLEFRPDKQTLGPAIQVRENMSAARFEELLQSNAFTTNARKLRPKSVDIYMDAWDGEKFGPITDKQKQAAARREQQKKADAQVRMEAKAPVTPQAPVAATNPEPAPAPPLSTGGFSFASDDDGFDYPAGPVPSPVPPVTPQVIKRKTKEATNEERTRMNNKLNGYLTSALRGISMPQNMRKVFKDTAGQLMLLDLPVIESLHSGLMSSNPVERMNAKWNLIRHFASVDKFNLDENVAALKGDVKNILNSYDYLDNPDINVFPRGINKEVQEEIHNLVVRVESCTDAIFDVAMKMRTDISDMGLTAEDFTVEYIDFYQYDNLPSGIKDMLKTNKDIDKEAYDKKTEEDKEMTLNCAGV